MKELNTNKDKQISRRKILPILGGGLLIPFFGFGNSNDLETTFSEEDEYKTLLKSDGTTVNVKMSVLKNSKIVKKKVSNKSLLSWLKPNQKG
jgi:hypothetical protein